MQRDDKEWEKRLAFAGIDARIRADLSALLPLVEGAFPAILQRFYAYLRNWDDLRRHIKDDTVVARLQERQMAHWRMLFSGRFDEDYFARARAVGEAHHRIGLSPQWYVGGYAIVLADLIALLTKRLWYRPARLARAGNALTRAVLFDLEVATSVYVEAGRTALQKELMQLADSLEEQVTSRVNSVSEHSAAARENATQMHAAAERSGSRSATVATASEQAAANVDTVAAAAQEFAASAQEIGRQTGLSKSVAEKAVVGARDASEVMQGLAGYAEEIGAIVEVISNIADQTNLLALNATIEAARAGDAGRGFAVVAGEVKSLAVQTSKATEQIGTQISGIQEAANRAVAAIEAVSAVIAELDGVTDAINGAAEQQNIAACEISNNVQEAAAGNREVTTNIQGVAEDAAAVADLSKKMQVAAGSTATAIESLRTAVGEVLAKLRSHTAFDRRHSPRSAAAPGARIGIRYQNRRHSVDLVNIGQGGGLVAGASDVLQAGDKVMVELQEGCAAIAAEILENESGRLRFRFTEAPADLQKAVAAVTSPIPQARSAA
ncbi:MAG: protoglobin domain-containing protein [Pseudomonadota bacterium]